MKRPFYVVMFALLGSVIGAIVAWSTEFAYLTMLDFESIGDISVALGYAFDKKDAFNYVYLILFALGTVVGVIHGLKAWDQVYGDKIIPLRRGNKSISIALYTMLIAGILILASVTDVFGFKEIGKSESDKKSESLVLERITQTSTVYGIVMIDEACEEGKAGIITGREKCVSRPYQTEFALFKAGEIQKVVESNENGSFEVLVPPGEYEIKILPGSKAEVNLKNSTFLANAGEKIKLEVRYAEVGENR